MADEASTISFTIWLRRAGMENGVKYAILHMHMSLCLRLCASVNQAFVT